MGEEQHRGSPARRLSQLFDPLSRLSEYTTYSGAGSSAPGSPRLAPQRTRVPPAPPRPHASLLDLVEAEQAGTSQAVNWQERCLELQLELHRLRHQAGRVRDVFREKLTELEQKVVEAESRARHAEDKPIK